MKEVFKLKFEFDKELFRQKVANCINQSSKGYICVIDANVLTMAYNNPTYREIVNSSYVNTCDGSSIASMVNLIYKTNYMAHKGPDIFGEYIEKNIPQLLLGNTPEKAEKIKEVLRRKGVDSSHLSHLPLPFLGIDEFDYKKIATEINALNPHIIWVSLGAPKQEIFMSRILPYIKKGVMFGIGAAFNFYTGELKHSEARIGSLRFIWLHRLMKEPRKLCPRLYNYLKILPIIYFTELRYSKKIKV